MGPFGVLLADGPQVSCGLVAGSPVSEVPIGRVPAIGNMKYMDRDRIEQLLSRTTLRQIQVMVVLQRHNSMTKAAEDLGMSVANVSRMSKCFELNLGMRIFVGDRRRSVLLEEAHQIIDYLKPVLTEIELLADNLESAEFVLPPLAP
jgi:DNA-binding MarR family transcriptional regulator